MANLFARFSRKAIISFLLLMLLGLGVFFYFYARGHSVQVAVQSLEVFGSIAKILPIPADTKKEIEVITQLTEALTAQDDEERKYLILLQNNMELRPGGGFLGQYAVLTIKNGQVVSHFFEDANLLDQRIITPVAPPSPLRTMLSLKKWKFRDSNFSPDFPTNVEKAKYFYRLAGKNSNFDGVIAVNADVLTHVLLLTGPITAYGRTFTADNVVLDLEEVVEKPYLGEDVPAELKQNRKAIMKTMTEIIIERLSSLNNVPKIANLILEELRNKDIMISFEDASLQTAIESVHWDGRVASGWEGDYLMIVDANLGALKTDYYIKRRYEYTVDFTGGTDINTQDKNYRTVVTQQADQSQQTQEDVEGVKRPRVTLRVHYDHTAPQGNWRTSDYHT
ncbi:MAG TPA: DUF4012 domain-containing protein, partial [Patescibacteria group bacterium]|nr:DUF4012 domain-containing protein [Patescibacteria group bacterium]